MEYGPRNLVSCAVRAREWFGGENSINDIANVQDSPRLAWRRLRRKRRAIIDSEAIMTGLRRRLFLVGVEWMREKRPDQRCKCFEANVKRRDGVVVNRHDWLVGWSGVANLRLDRTRDSRDGGCCHCLRGCRSSDKESMDEFLRSPRAHQLSFTSTRILASSSISLPLHAYPGLPIHPNDPIHCPCLSSNPILDYTRIEQCSSPSVIPN